jgi:hypothetical protein
LVESAPADGCVRAVQRHDVTALTWSWSWEELGGAGGSSGQPPAKAMLQKYLQTTASGRMHEAEAVLQLVAEGHDDNRPHAGVRLPRASQPAGQLGFEARRMHEGSAPLISPITGESCYISPHRFPGFVYTQSTLPHYPHTHSYLPPWLLKTPPSTSRPSRPSVAPRGATAWKSTCSTAPRPRTSRTDTS